MLVLVLGLGLGLGLGLELGLGLGLRSGLVGCPLSLSLSLQATGLPAGGTTLAREDWLAGEQSGSQSSGARSCALKKLSAHSPSAGSAWSGGTPARRSLRHATHFSGWWRGSTTRRS